MFEKIARPPVKTPPAKEADHRCTACLMGGDAQKRACAIRRMLAEGYPVQQIDRMRGPYQPQ